MTVGAWYHLAGVYDPDHSVISLYVNGSKEAYAATGNSAIANTTGHFRVADDQQTLEGAKGVLDDIRIYAKALSQVEVLSLYYEVPSNKDGSLDTTFGNNGIVTTPGGSGYGVKIQTDSKIVVVGTSTDQKYMVTRYNSDGSLDNAFGNGGIVITQVGNGWSYGRALALQSDGRIVLVGTYEISNNNSGIALVRYNSNGLLDNSFGNNGIVTLDITGGYDYANSIAIQSSDQKILVAGQTNSIMVARFNSNGTLDNTFGTNGIVTTQVGSTSGSNSMKLQTDGKILVTGGTMDSQGYTQIVTIRYNANSSLDQTFGTGGIVTTAVGTVFQWGQDLDTQIDGKIIVGAIRQISSVQVFVLLRYNSDGSLDNSFGPGGIIGASPVGIFDALRSVALQTDGKILAGGFSVIDTTGIVPLNMPQIGMSLMRFETNGSLDTSFGHWWWVDVIPLGEYGLESGRGLAIQNDNKIVFVGSSIEGTKIARFNVTSISSVEETTSGEIPEEFVLQQNYPNPFNPSTTIQFSIPEQSFVKLEAFNALGEKVSTLVSKELNVGSYEVEFNSHSGEGRNLPSGIYFYKLSTNNFSEIKKMILLK
jgi:uncharacterized delta-60 repeat protein